MASNSQSPGGARTQFKTPEGRYRLAGEKAHPIGPSHYSPPKAVTKVTIAHLKDRPLSFGSLGSISGSSSSIVSSFASSTATRFSSRLGNGGSFFRPGGNNGIASKFTGGGRSLLGGGPSSSGLGNNGGTPGITVDGEATYIIFNIGDTLFISDYNSHDKDPVKSLHFNNIQPGCHAFSQRITDGHDLLIGLTTGDVYTASLRAQLQDPGKKLVGAVHYYKDASVAGNRCTAVSWVPHAEGMFVSAHADGNIYVYDKNKDGNGESPFPVVKDPGTFAVTHTRSTKNNPIARWHISAGSVNGVAFSVDGHYLATVGRDGLLRIFDFYKEALVCGCKSYFGALLCCAWSKDSKYVLVGGEDDLVQVWSMEDRKVVAWGEGHNSWVSGVAFDPYWSPPAATDGGDESMTYRIGSVGQDTQLFLWDFALDEVVFPLRSAVPLASSPRAPVGKGGSSSDMTGHMSPHSYTHGVLQPPAVRKNIPRINLVMAHKVHAEPLSDLVFTKGAIITACQDGHVKIWQRPTASSDAVVPASGNHSNGEALAGGGGKFRGELRETDRERRQLFPGN